MRQCSPRGQQVPPPHVLEAVGQRFEEQRAVTLPLVPRVYAHLLQQEVVLSSGALHMPERKTNQPAVRIDQQPRARPEWPRSHQVSGEHR